MAAAQRGGAGLTRFEIQLLVKEKSKVFKYAEWSSKWLTNESQMTNTGDLMK